MAKNFYKILGVSEDATKEDIKKAYRKLARKWHPDINPGNSDAEKKFKEIASAYDCLGNDEKRKLYDEFGEDSLHSGFEADKARQYRKWQSAEETGTGNFRSGFSGYQNYEDILGDLFNFTGNAESGFGTKSPLRGKNIEFDMNIDFISALKGFETEIAIQRPLICKKCNGKGVDTSVAIKKCSTCGGSGKLKMAKGPVDFMRQCQTCAGTGEIRTACSSCQGIGSVVGTEKIKVTIPSGVKEGSKVRVAGKGGPGTNGQPAGDLYLIVHVNEHPVLKRDGDNLYMDVPVTIYELMAGATILIPSINGKVKVKIPAKSQNGQTLKLKGKGAVNIKTKKQGDMLIKLSVMVPVTEDKETLEAVKKMAGLYPQDIRSGIIF